MASDQMTTLTPDQLAELRRLFQESTQGEWFAFRSTVANVAKWTIQIARGWLFVQSDKATQTDCVWASEAHNHFESLLAAAENERRLREGIANAIELLHRKDDYQGGMDALAELIGRETFGGMKMQEVPIEEVSGRENTTQEPADAP